jgi:hypothetical protein
VCHPVITLQMKKLAMNLRRAMESFHIHITQMLNKNVED